MNLAISPPKFVTRVSNATPHKMAHVQIHFKVPLLASIFKELMKHCRDQI